MTDEFYEEEEAFAEWYAENKGLTLNPDLEARKRVLKGLANNQKKYGIAYCPCRVITGDQNLDCKNICPCDHYPDEIDDIGRCHCSLFFKKGEDE